METVSLCEEAFDRRGLGGAWPRVFAAVAQPGVEYGDQEIHGYDRQAAAELCRAARALPGIVLEGHSTDYQCAAALRQLVEDGVAVLKVGPALTFALRECLFGLERIEQELEDRLGGQRLSGLSDALERAMLDNPVHWKGYYAGSREEQKRARRYSFSDRSRYYWTAPGVDRAVGALRANLDTSGIPLNLLSQHLPRHFRAVREGRLQPRADALLQESVLMVLRDYSNAARGAV
jgi:D-tagatose-1,6-bisphosphate aldolase subunit GatZ/KbaZ